MGPHMFSVHTACEKKIYVWNLDNWILKMRAILGRLLIFYAFVAHGLKDQKYLGANTSEASDVRCGIHYVKAREEMTTLFDESSHFILKLSVNHHYQWFSHHMHHIEVSLFVASNQTQLIICTGTSMADSGLCFFACKRS